MAWWADAREVGAILKTLKRSQPSKGRPPFLPPHLNYLYRRLDRDDPFEAAVLAAAAIGLFGLLRSGEFFPPSASSHDGRGHRLARRPVYGTMSIRLGVHAVLVAGRSPLGAAPAEGRALPASGRAGRHSRGRSRGVGG